jgi:hypothetical protein
VGCTFTPSVEVSRICTKLTGLFFHDVSGGSVRDLDRMVVPVPRPVSVSQVHQGDHGDEVAGLGGAPRLQGHGRAVEMAFAEVGESSCANPEEAVCCRKVALSLDLSSCIRLDKALLDTAAERCVLG